MKTNKIKNIACHELNNISGGGSTCIRGIQIMHSRFEELISTDLSYPECVESCVRLEIAPEIKKYFIYANSTATYCN